MSLRHQLLLVFLIALVGCDQGEEAGPGAAPDGIEIRPRWEIGQVFEVREETENRSGLGSFPPAGRLEQRTARLRLRTDVYRITVLEADGHRLLRTERTYLTSRAGKKTSRKPTPLEGLTLVLEQPFGNPPSIQVRSEGGELTPPTKEITSRLLGSPLRLCVSLLPRRPVPVGSSWRPGRALDMLVLGQGAVRARVLLESVDQTPSMHTARVSSVTTIPIVNGPLAGSSLQMREGISMDLTRGHIGTYNSVTEWYIPATREREEGWKRVESSLSFSPVTPD